MEKTRIDGIFRKGRCLEVPFFQRSYVWSEENWERFLEDMENVCINNKDYFMGTYILKQQEVPSTCEIGEIRTVIDGQQRFTTILIFFYVLFQKQNQQSQFKELFFNRSSRIGLKHNHNDVEIFEAIINGNLTEELKEKYENNQVLKAYNYFETNLNIDKLNANTLLNKLYFVGIDVQQNEDEQQIFDTINSLGVRLTTAELLKNYLFANLDDIQLYNETWKSCFEKDLETKNFWDELITSGSKTRNNIDMLLYSYLSVFYKKDFTIDSLFSSFKDYLKEVDYKNNKERILNQIISYANLYRDNINTACCDEALQETSSSISRLNIIFFGLDTTTVIPYCLYVLKNSEILEQQKIFEFLEAYIMRRMVCDWSTKNYNNMFQSFIRSEILTAEALKNEIYNTKKDFSKNSKMPDDEEIVNVVKNTGHTNKKAKGILYLLETASRNEKHCTSLLAFSKYDLEHIMPQSWDINWKLKDSSSENIKRRNEYISLLGNKTILSSRLNRAIKNAEWKIKKTGNGSKYGLERYASGLETFNFQDINEWNEDKIDERNVKLANLINEYWIAK